MMLSLFYTIPAVLGGKSGRDALKVIPRRLQVFGKWCIWIFVALLLLAAVVG